MYLQSKMPTKKIVQWAVVFGAVVVILVVAVLFFPGIQDYLGARVIGVSGGRISVRQGETISLQVPLVKASSAKVELCQEGKNPEKCTLLIGKISSKVVSITIPKNAVLGKAIIKVTERNSKGVITNNVLMRRTLLIAKLRPTPTPTPESSGSSGGGGGSGGGSSGDSNSQSNSQAINYELSRLCYESDKTVHIIWKPPVNGVRFRKSGDTPWLPDISRCGFNGCADVVYFDASDYKTAIIYTSSSNVLPPNTDFEFQIVPYSSSPDGSPENSQLYKFNSGPLPAFGQCRSLL